MPFLAELSETWKQILVGGVVVGVWVLLQVVILPRLGVPT